MVTHRGGWGKYAKEHSAKVGGTVLLGGHIWTIWMQSGYKIQIENEKKKLEEHQEKRLNDPSVIEMAKKHPNVAIRYIFRIQKTTRQIDYKKSDWFRLLRRVKK